MENTEQQNIELTINDYQASLYFNEPKKMIIFLDNLLNNHFDIKNKKAYDLFIEDENKEAIRQSDEYKYLKNLKSGEINSLINIYQNKITKN